ncbi:MAG: hypothetical protein GTO51_03455 [Candidatus Latescibacteria bacterium]|nr:hypothetical protein [Candidatus Latescibacterota bacterium]NIM20895.1 hypothetical protein [Candidatus Latescibacterota bacterium]NIM65030.1 hypothetical protein [Candidatus Latescibacterota bacterium]NIO01545.1 hypothetical protein [Candidatus Latescibacterota bacterium]NIO28062.1 hypothetical protein [Candidatus Latescibacterota bacterium]
MKPESLLLSLVLIVLPRSAYAYLDPGTGSYILQLLLAGLLGAAFALKIFWVKIKTFFAGLLAKRSKNE